MVEIGQWPAVILHSGKVVRPRIHILHYSYIMKSKPRLHNGIVTITDKNRLAEIRPSCGEPPDDGLTKIQ